MDQTIRDPVLQDRIVGKKICGNLLLWFVLLIGEQDVAADCVNIRKKSLFS